MSILNADKLFEITSEEQNAIPSFDISGGNMDILHAVFKITEKRQATTFISSTPESIEAYFGINSYIDTINQVAKNYDVNFSIHLDHAREPDYIFKAINNGFSSVMYDGSSLQLNENIDITKDIVSEANKNNVSVEAELGIIGGKEDEIFSEQSLLPSISDCIEFVNQTDINLFAPAIGTAHGIYNNSPQISWELVEQLNTDINIPLVLHGGSGLDTKTLKRLINNNFKKINFATGIRQAFLNGILDTIKEVDGIIKPQKYLLSGRKKVHNFIDNILSLHFEMPSEN